MVPGLLTSVCQVQGVGQVVSAYLVWAPRARLRCHTCWGQCHILDAGALEQQQRHVFHFSLTVPNDHTGVPSA